MEVFLVRTDPQFRPMQVRTVVTLRYMFQFRRWAKRYSCYLPVSCSCSQNGCSGRPVQRFGQAIWSSFRECKTFVLPNLTPLFPLLMLLQEMVPAKIKNKLSSFTHPHTVMNPCGYLGIKHVNLTFCVLLHKESHMFLKQNEVVVNNGYFLIWLNLSFNILLLYNPGFYFKQTV